MALTIMRYHFVTGTKERAPLITPEVEPELYDSIREAAVEAGGCAIEIGGIEDHVHLVAAVRPDVAPSTFIGKVKGQTSRELAEKHSELEEFAWQTGYGGFTLSPFELGRVRSYVENQKAHHERGTTWEQLERTQDP